MLYLYIIQNEEYFISGLESGKPRFFFAQIRQNIFSIKK